MAETFEPMDQHPGNTGCKGAAEPRISLIVPTLGRSAELAEMFASMGRQTEEAFELIVVDQNDDDRVVPHVTRARENGLSVKHVRRTEKGAAAARNAGVRHAVAPLIGFPDDDCWYEPDVIARVIAHFDREPALTALVGHWVEEDPQGLRPAETLDAAKWRRFHVGSVPAFALFFKTAGWRDVSGFAENFGPGCFFGCAEEEDLMFRLLGRRARIDYVPEIDIHHPHHDAPAATTAQKWRSRSYGRGTGGVLAKHKLPMWVVARGLAGPFVHAIKAPNRCDALVLGAYTAWGRIEGLAAWWAGRGNAQG